MMVQCAGLRPRRALRTPARIGAMTWSRRASSAAMVRAASGGVWNRRLDTVRFYERRGVGQHVNAGLRATGCSPRGSHCTASPLDRGDRLPKAQRSGHRNPHAGMVLEATSARDRCGRLGCDPRIGPRSSTSPGGGGRSATTSSPSTRSPASFRRALRVWLNEERGRRPRTAPVASYA
jgi:hypothetical protein